MNFYPNPKCKQYTVLQVPDQPKLAYDEQRNLDRSIAFGNIRSLLLLSLLFLSNPSTLHSALPFSLGNVKWLHSDVSGWRVTANLKRVSTSASSIVLDYDKANSWPVGSTGGTAVVANPWIFIEESGRWYAATFEWLRPGQTKKSIRAVNGDHIKRSPFQSWKPNPGTTYYFMVSGLARGAERNVKERSNIVAYTWPGSSAGTDGDSTESGTGSTGGSSTGSGGAGSGNSDGSGSAGSGSGGTGGSGQDPMTLKPRKFVKWAFQSRLGRKPTLRETLKYAGQISMGILSKKKLLEILEKKASSSFDLSGVTWLYPDVSGWAQTAELKVSFSGNRIIMDYSTVASGPGAYGKDNPKGFNANGWIFVKRSGQWLGATWTWLRPEKSWRDISDVSGSTIKREPLGSFKPASGETYYFMVSGLARMGLKNIKERSNLVKVTWP